jgi:hypothetical protein
MAPTASVASAEPARVAVLSSPTIELPEAERKEVGGQQHRNVTVGECAQRASDEQRKNGRIDA